MDKQWGIGATIGNLYRLKNQTDLDRVGLCWMRGRLKQDDLILCIKHTGDCFFDYILIKEYANGLKGIPQSRFGAYVLGEEVDKKLNEKEFHLLCAGEFIDNDEKKN